MTKRFNASRIALLGALTALALIAYAVESLFPPLIVPGARLGLGNVFVILALVYLGGAEAAIVVAAKCLLAAAFGGLSALIYSLPAGLISLAVSWFLTSLNGRVSIVAVCAAAATVHNLVQNLIFAAVMQTAEVLAYSPYLALTGSICGIITGLAVYLISKIAAKAFKNKGGNI